MNRVFLLLQGPHGPFFHQLGKMLRQAGAEVWRVAFNKGDDNFWFHNPSLIRFTEEQARWPARLADLLAEKRVTDVVLYGDIREIHAEAVRQAKALGLTVHVFEEGYVRPYWVTYERGGSSGNSRLVGMTVVEMQAALARAQMDLPRAPARWGDMAQHIFYGALYHFFVLARNGTYSGFRPHRSLSVGQEFGLYLQRLLLMPLHSFERMVAQARIRFSGFPYHLVLMQLAHDASFMAHGPFASMAEFIDVVTEGFAKGAPRHHHLVFKAHPLEDGRAQVRREIFAAAARHGVAQRVHFVRGGKLARLLAQARSCVTVNSTAAEQALWRGLPVRIFGRAVYGKPEFVSDQPLTEFFANPRRPDSRAYRDYRHYLLETSQVPGSFYAAHGRRRLLRQVVDMMLAPLDPYDALIAGTAAPRQQVGTDI